MANGKALTKEELEFVKSKKISPDRYYGFV